MPELTLERTVRISEDAVFRELDGEAVILQLESGMYFGLDPIATRLWQLIDAHGRLAPVLNAAIDEFEVDRQTLERDLLRLVSELAERKLVTVE
jgi:hypothetical protein